MPGRRCEFFADEGDLLNLMNAFKQLGNFKYVQIRSELNKPNCVFQNPVEVLSFAPVTPKVPTRRHSVLVLQIAQQIYSRSIDLVDGSGTRTIVDQSQNMDSIALALGGNAGDQTLIMSEIGTTAETANARAMHKAFCKEVYRHSTNLGPKGRPCRLMPGAIFKLKAGWRLARGKEWHTGTDPVFSEDEIAKLEC